MKNSLSYIRYPIYARKPTMLESIAKAAKAFPIKCNICGSATFIDITNDNFRENCYCRHCHSFNRQRQIAYVLCNAMSGRHSKTLKEFGDSQNITIYNAEAGGTLHRHLSSMKGYVCSEYFGDEYSSGDFVNNTMHQDLMSLSFRDNCFDVIITTDVFEHIPDPYKAHSEVHRVLKTGGRHVFTVPFYQTEILDEVRATITKDRETIFHKEPLYHVDPLRKDGILVYNIFSIEMLSKLSQIGFRTNMYLLYIPLHGIFGPNGLVFEAIKER